MFNIKILVIDDKGHYAVARRKFFHPYWGWELIYVNDGE